MLNDLSFSNFNTEGHKTGQNSHEQMTDLKLGLRSAPGCFGDVMVEVARLCSSTEAAEPSSGAWAELAPQGNQKWSMFPVYKYFL